MKILILTGSPRQNGNSAVLAEYFIRGAREAGHETVRFDAAFKTVHPCTACNSCSANGPCIFKDDFELVRRHITQADAVAFVTPMYYFGLSAQLKTVIDRFYAVNRQIRVPKKAFLLVTYADSGEKEAHPILAHYQTLLDYLGWENAGTLAAPGVWEEGGIKKTPYPAQAYTLGKNLR